MSNPQFFQSCKMKAMKGTSARFGQMILSKILTSVLLNDVWLVICYGWKAGHTLKVWKSIDIYSESLYSIIYPTRGEIYSMIVIVASNICLFMMTLTCPYILPLTWFASGPCCGYEWGKKCGLFF